MSESEDVNSVEVQLMEHQTTIEWLKETLRVAVAEALRAREATDRISRDSLKDKENMSTLVNTSMETVQASLEKVVSQLDQVAELREKVVGFSADVDNLRTSISELHIDASLGGPVSASKLSELDGLIAGVNEMQRKVLKIASLRQADTEVTSSSLKNLDSRVGHVEQMMKRLISMDPNENSDGLSHQNGSLSHQNGSLSHQNGSLSHQSGSLSPGGSQSPGNALTQARSRGETIFNLFAEIRRISAEVKSVKQKDVPELDEIWGAKFRSLFERVYELEDRTRRHEARSDELLTRNEAKEKKMDEILALSGLQRSFSDRLDKSWRDISLKTEGLHDRLVKVESLQESIGSQGPGLAAMSEMLELHRAETRASLERVARTSKQELDALAQKVERLQVLRDEVFRMSGQIRASSTIPHNPIQSNSNPIQSSNNPIQSSNNYQSSNSIQPSHLVHSNRVGSPEKATNQSVNLLSFAPRNQAGPSTLDFSSGFTQNGSPSSLSSVVVKLPLFADELGSETGSVQVTGQRVLWHIRGFDEIPKTRKSPMVSPEFDLEHNGLCVTGRLKLFPFGSPVCKKKDWSSVYMRFTPAVKVRCTVDLAGASIHGLECLYEKPKDKGMHEFVENILSYCDRNGGLNVGIEIKTLESI